MKTMLKGWLTGAGVAASLMVAVQAAPVSGSQGEVVLMQNSDGHTTVRAVSGELHTRSAQPWTPDRLQAALKAMPKGGVSRGKALHSSMLCSSCHGAAGESVSPNWPSLNGQRADYTYKMLLDYQSGLRREDHRAGVMNAVAELLSQQDMADLAAFYAAQPLTPASREGNAATLKMVRKGDPQRLATPCASCHGLGGQGGINETPALAGLPVTYFVRTMQHYKHGSRHNDAQQAMRAFAKPLSDEEIVQLAHYYAAMPKP